MVTATHAATSGNIVLYATQPASPSNALPSVMLWQLHFFSCFFRRKLVCIQHNLRVFSTSVAELNFGLSLPRMTGHNFISITPH
jgi:hypothetical protein